MSKGDPQSSKILIALCILTGVIALLFLPVTQLDRLPIRGDTAALADKSIRSFKSTNSYKAPSYLVCSIDDDPEGYNNYGIYHPVDLAVTISQLKKLGINHLFLGAHLHWPELDPQENGTLSTAIKGLDSCIISIPLRRTAGAVEIPDYLLASSVSAETIKGDINLLPQVNNLSLAPTFKIPENTQAGFSQLETETISRKIPLLALWDERVILSSLLLERLYHLNIKPNDLVINLGNSIELGNSGSIIPIDEFGYFSPSDYPDEKKPDITSSYITAHKKSPVATHNGILTASGLKADSYRAINQPVAQLNQLALTLVVSDGKIYKRPPIFIQIATLLAVIYLLISTNNLLGIKKLFWYLLLILFLVGVAAVLARSSDYYIALSPLIIIILISAVYTFISGNRNEIISDSNQGYIHFDEVSNSFIKKNIVSTSAKKATKKRKRERRKKGRKNNKSKKNSK